MSNVGYDTWYRKTCPTVFIVRNIANEGKTVKLFNYPVLNGMERDLMAIPFVSEADIRHSLLKGQLLIKLKHKEIIVTASNIDLLQFDECQKDFLKESGILEGLEVSDGYIIAELPFTFKQGVSLIGALDGNNRIFTTPNKFIQGTFGANKFAICIKHNGRDLVETIDYIVSESSGVGTGFDTIIFISFTPKNTSVLRADYVIPTLL